MGKVLVERDSTGVVWLTINRSEKRNAIDFDVMQGIEDIVDEFSSNSTDKVLVITGAGQRAFCSGGDLSEFHNLYTKNDAYQMLSKMGGILYKLLMVPKPTVALLNGAAIGGGCEIAAACDFRVASRNATIGFVQGKLGITTGWGGATMLLEKLPHDRAMKMLMTASRISANEAAEIGFVHELFDPDANLETQCREWLGQFVDQSTGVLEAYKQTAIRKWQQTNIRDRMFAEIERCSILWESDDHHRAVKSFLKD